MQRPAVKVQYDQNGRRIKPGDVQVESPKSPTVTMSTQRSPTRITQREVQGAPPTRRDGADSPQANYNYDYYGDYAAASMPLPGSSQQLQSSQPLQIRPSNFKKVPQIQYR